MSGVSIAIGAVVLCGETRGGRSACRNKEERKKTITTCGGCEKVSSIVIHEFDLSDDDRNRVNGSKQVECCGGYERKRQ